METNDQSTAELQIEKFIALDDQTLDIIFGQHVGRYICDKPADDATRNAPPFCNLHGVGHWAPNEWGRWQPIGEGGEAFDHAITAAQALLAPDALEIIEHHEPAPRWWDVSVTQSHDGGRVLTRAYICGALDGEHSRRVIRRAVIICLLAITYAPDHVLDYLVRVEAEAKIRRDAEPAEPMVGDPEHSL